MKKGNGYAVKQILGLILLQVILFCILLSGCGKKSGESDGSASASGTQSNASDSGNVLNIYGWNTEFQERMIDYYPGYKENGDGTGSIGNVTVNWIITPTEKNAYQNKLDQVLLTNMDAAADDKMDLFLMEADYILKYVDSDYTLDVEADLGLTANELSDQYEYTKEIATSQDGKLKGVSWQATPGLFAYRRSIAKDVLGTDDPDEVQKKLSNWEKFDAVAAKAAKKGYKMISGTGDNFKVFANNVAKPWVEGVGSESPKIQIDEKLMEWVKKSKKYVENDWNNASSMWDEQWNFDQSPKGKVFGFFYSTWGINYTLVGNAGEEGAGDWAVCEGPAAWYWGGTWIAGARGTDNKSIVADIMRTFTCDKKTMVRMTRETQDYTNTMSGMKQLADSDYASEFLGGQNHIALFAEAAPKISMKNAGPYDQGLNDSFQEAFGPYNFGEIDMETALHDFYDSAVVKYPELTYDEITLSDETEEKEK